MPLRIEAVLRAKRGVQLNIRKVCLLFCTVSVGLVLPFNQSSAFLKKNQQYVKGFNYWKLEQLDQTKTNRSIPLFKPAEGVVVW
jgi:hypothetical protein